MDWFSQWDAIYYRGGTPTFINSRSKLMSSMLWILDKGPNRSAGNTELTLFSNDPKCCSLPIYGTTGDWCSTNDYAIVSTLWMRLRCFEMIFVGAEFSPSEPPCLMLSPNRSKEVICVSLEDPLRDLLYDNIVGDFRIPRLDPMHYSERDDGR